VDDWNIVWYWLPAKIKLFKPRRLFCASKDGFNLNTIMVKAKKEEYTLIVLKTSTGKIFGAYVSCLWEKLDKYSGTGEMFIFSLSPFKKYAWTKKNPFFFMIDAKTNSLMIGGGEGTAIYLDVELNHGSSRTSETFDNDPLNFPDTEFQCVSAEVFAFRK